MNIVAALLEEYAPLHQEVDFLLREELRDLSNYHAILLAIAEQPLSLTELGTITGLGNNVQYHLQQLTQLGYVARRSPLTGQKGAKRAVRYVLDDPLLRFWFRFVGPNQSRLRVPGARATFAARIRPRLEAYFGSCFERLCREALPWLYEREGVTATYEIGSFWDREVQIDLISVRDDGCIDLGECKWGPVRSAQSVAQELLTKLPKFPASGTATLVPRIFLRSPPRSPPKDAAVRCHSLADLYE